MAFTEELLPKNQPDTPEDRATFYIRPAARLEEDAEYVVAIRDLRLEDGSVVEPSDYFRALRDGIETDVASLEARRDRFEEVFATLEGAGVERDGLIDAWHFRTASGSSSGALVKRGSVARSPRSRRTWASTPSGRSAGPSRYPSMERASTRDRL